MFNNSDSFRLGIKAYDADFNLINDLGYLPITSEEDFRIDINASILELFQEYTVTIPEDSKNPVKINKELFTIFIGKKSPYYENTCDVWYIGGLNRTMYALDKDDRIVANSSEAKKLILEISREYEKFNTAVEKIKTLGKN